MSSHAPWGLADGLAHKPSIAPIAKAVQEIIEAKQIATDRQIAQIDQSLREYQALITEKART